MTAVHMVRQIKGVAECVGDWLRDEDQGLPAARRSVLSREAQHTQYCFRCELRSSPSEAAGCCVKSTVEHMPAVLNFIFRAIPADRLAGDSSLHGASLYPGICLCEII